MLIKLFNLNLHGYWNWNKRINKLVKSIKKYDPDIITLQEAQIDKNISSTNQAEEINSFIKYPYLNFAPCFDSSIDYGKGSTTNHSIIEGLAIISKLSFSSSHADLPITKKLDRWPRIIQNCHNQQLTITNIHLSKHHPTRLNQYPLLPSENILIGDFNAQPKEISSHLKNLQSSYEFKKYISFPTQNITLDYCLIPKGNFVKLITITDLSDHNAIYCELQI